MKTMRFLSFGLMILALTLTSCSPEDGADGSTGLQGLQGAAGADGVDGVDGADGADGADGVDGNANVSSRLFEAFPVAIGDNVFDVPEITQDILDNGFVHAYINVTGTDTWFAVPYSIANATGTIDVNIDTITLSTVNLFSSFAQTLNVRFVVVAGINVSGVDFSDFKEVKKRFGF